MLVLLPADLRLVMPLINFEPGEMFSALAGLVIALFGLHIGGRLTPVNLLLTVLGIMTGAAIAYSLFVIAASLVLYNKGLATGINLAMDLVQFGQYPMRFYPGALRIIFTWGLPLAVIANVPAHLVEAGLSRLPWYLLPGSSDWRWRFWLPRHLPPGGKAVCEALVGRISVFSERRKLALLYFRSRNRVARGWVGLAGKKETIMHDGNREVPRAA